MEISKLSDKQHKIIVTKRLTELERRRDGHSDNLKKKKKKERKKVPTEVTIELKNILEFNSKLDEAEKHIDELEDKAIEITQTEQ